MKKKGTRDYMMKHYGNDAYDSYENERTKSHDDKKRRQQKNWTRLYQDHETEYDDLDDFHN